LSGTLHSIRALKMSRVRQLVHTGFRQILPVCEACQEVRETDGRV
jgi:hypothetical protein